MESLQVLEQKINLLISCVKELKEENAQLAEQKKLLETELVEFQKKIETMEVSLLSHSQNLHEEKELARFAVDELIKNIDSLVGSE